MSTHDETPKLERDFEAAVTPKSTYTDNIYTRMFGIRPVIGAFEAFTSYGNSRMSSTVLKAMAEANEYFVSMDELNASAGRRIAQIVGTEAAMVTAGSACSMMLAAAACMTGTDREKIEALPHPTWPKRECLMQRGHRFNFDEMYRAAGATIVTVDSKEELINAISDKTALIACMAMTERLPTLGVLTVAELIEIGKRAGIPVHVDNAGEAPPIAKFTQYTALGADLMNVSGGKAIQGPPSSGILAGRRDLIEAALLHASPNHAIGRGAKVGKEEIVGLMVALEEFVHRDQAAALARYSAMARYIVEQLQGVPGLSAHLQLPAKGFDDAELAWNQDIIPLSEREVTERLLDGEPRIVCMPKLIYAYTGPTLVTALLRPGEEIMVAKRVKQMFLDAGRKA